MLTHEELEENAFIRRLADVEAHREAFGKIMGWPERTVTADMFCRALCFNEMRSLDLFKDFRAIALSKLLLATHEAYEDLNREPVRATFIARALAIFGALLPAREGQTYAL